MCVQNASGLIGPYSLSGRTNNLSIRAQKWPDNELYSKQLFGPITRPKCYGSPFLMR